jgi:hypothetical protein
VRNSVDSISNNSSAVLPSAFTSVFPSSLCFESLRIDSASSLERPVSFASSTGLFISNRSATLLMPAFNNFCFCNSLEIARSCN